jgi:hypothetical protein
MSSPKEADMTPQFRGDLYRRAQSAKIIVVTRLF